MTPQVKYRDSSPQGALIPPQGTHLLRYPIFSSPSMSPQVMKGDSSPSALGVSAGVGKRLLKSRGVPAAMHDNHRREALGNRLHEMLG
eukprot:1157301-Pelagomonas_calceolata.AAC.9